MTANNATSSAANASSTWDTIVVGAGQHGLTAAALLAQRGQRVLLLEARAQLGGIAARQELTVPGNDLDLYKSAGWLPDATCIDLEVVDRLNLRQRGAEFRPAPAVLVPEQQGPGLLLQSEPRQWLSELIPRSSHDAQQLERFRRDCNDFSTALRPLLRGAALPLTALGWNQSWRGLKLAWQLRKNHRELLPRLLRVLPMSLSDWLREYFEDPLLLAAIAAPALLCSSVGPRAAGTVGQWLWQYSLSHDELVGGGAQWIDLLVGSCLEHGVEISTETTVARIMVSDGQVGGVTLADGRSLRAHHVICTCDPSNFLTLLPHDVRYTRFDGEIERWHCRGSTTVAAVLLDSPPQFRGREGVFERARIVGDLLDLERGADRVKYGEWGDPPYVEIRVPTASNPALAPPGHHLLQAWFQYTPCCEPPHDPEQLQKLLLAKLNWGVTNLERVGLHFRSWTPLQLQRQFRITGGHLYHGEHRLDQFLFQRPSPDCSGHATPIRGLFLAGSGTHPGGGLTSSSGRLVVDQF